jgi:hypothetical protein
MIAELAQGFISFAYSRLDFPCGKIRRRISTKDRFSDSFRTLHDVRWGAQTNATDQSAN